GNVTPFIGFGAAGCQESLQFLSFNTNQATNGGNPDGIAHFATLSGGITITVSVGVPVSLGYIYMRADYLQASDDDARRSAGPVVKGGLVDGLAANRRGVRFQVGGAF